MAIINNKLRNWLMSRGQDSFQFEDQEGNYSYLRKPERDGLDYIFCSSAKDTDPSQGLNFTYVGVFCKKDRMFYDTAACTYAEKTGLPHKNRYTMTEQLKKDVRQRVEALVGDDQRNLSVSEITDPKLARQLDNFREDGALSTDRSRDEGRHGCPGPETDFGSRLIEQRKSTFSPEGKRCFFQRLPPIRNDG